MIVVEKKEEEEVEEFKMAVKQTKKEDYSIFEFVDTHNSIVNAFRRTILDDVETFAIEDVKVIKNDSPLFEETIAHRLGLIPLKSDEKKNYVRLEDDPAGEIGSAKSIIKFKLKQSMPGYVYSEKLESDNPNVICSYDKIPVTKLINEGDILEVEAKAILGTGKEHSKWSPAHTYLKEVSKNKIHLIVEGFGQLDEKNIFNESIDILISKIEELEAGVK
jgi:DNA-directed RNA polymerase subunit D